MATDRGPGDELEVASSVASHRFSIGDMLLATVLAAVPLSFDRLIGWPAAACLVTMSLVTR